MYRRGRVSVLVVVVLAVLAPAAGAEAHFGPHLPAGDTIEVVVEGIDNPRNLAFDSNGDLYIPATGVGGTEGCGNADVGPVCAGLTGSILKVTYEQLGYLTAPVKATTIARNLISISYPGGTQALGLQGLAAKDGRVFGVFIGPEFIGTSQQEGCCRSNVTGALREAALQQLGNLMEVSPSGELTKVADVDHFEFVNNPVDVPNSDPYWVVIDSDGSFVIADAAANTLVRARHDGTVSLIAAFDDLIAGVQPGGTTSGGTEAVPTGVAIGPDGNYYVTLLAGNKPFLGRILQVTPSGAVRTIANGLSFLGGIAIAPNGTIYATEFSGDIVRMRPDATRPGEFLAPEFLYRQQLVTPTGIAIGPDGLLYVSDNSFLPGFPLMGGRVVRMKG